MRVNSAFENFLAKMSIVQPSTAERFTRANTHFTPPPLFIVSLADAIRYIKELKSSFRFRWIT